MSKRTVKKLLAVGAVSFSCLWLSVVPISKGWTQTSRDAKISAYIQQLKDNDGNICYYADNPLINIGGEAVPALLAALKDNDATLRNGAACTLGRIEKEAKAVVTSRLEEQLDQVPKTTIQPLRVAGDRLSSFMEAYLTQRGKRHLFTDVEYFDACRRLSLMVGQRNITGLLAKLYAEQMIATKEGNAVDLPDNIPDLMLAYLNET